MKFEKVSYEAFRKDLRRCGIGNNSLLESDIKRAYESIVLPERKTSRSAGYDFRIPVSIYLNGGFDQTVPTGVKVGFTEDEAKKWHLKLYIRSSLGIKHGIILKNCTGVIDADYYNNPDNEGDIMISLQNTGLMGRWIDAGERVMQGVFEMHGITDNDNAHGARMGGVGSTGRE